MTTLLDLALGKKPSNGWVHFKCPICPTKGLGPDTGYHLGIHTVSGGVHCWRCGARGLPPGYRTVGRAVLPVAGHMKQVKPRHTWHRVVPEQIPYSPWKGHAPTSLGGEWIETPRGFAVLMPFYGTDGYQIRYTDGQSPKVRNFGISGPAWVRKEDPAHPGAVVVEGWADGLGFPFARNILALLGVDNYSKVLKEIPSHWSVYLALDNDEAGKVARDNLTRLLLRRHATLYWASYRGKDPASAENEIVWKPIHSLSDMRNFDACQTA